MILPPPLIGPDLGSASGKQEVSTRVMIFSSFRESVQEIAAMLNRHQHVIRVMTFMGQASVGKVKGFTQKEQLEVGTTFCHTHIYLRVYVCIYNCMTSLFYSYHFYIVLQIRQDWCNPN